MGLLGRLRPKKAARADDAAPDLTDEKAAHPHGYAASTDGLADVRLVSTETALDVMADAIFRSTWPYGWFNAYEVSPEEWTDEVVTGVTILSSKGAPRSCPADHPGFANFEQAIAKLNARVAVKLRCKAVDVTMAVFIDSNPELYELHIDADTRIQVLDSIDQLGTARKNQYAAFVRDEGVLVVWADRVDCVVPAARMLEEALIAFVWANETSRSVTQPLLSRSSSSDGSSNGAPGSYRLAAPGTAEFGDVLPTSSEKVECEDPDKAQAIAQRKARPMALIAAVISGTAAAIDILLMGLGVRALVVQLFYDGNYIHLTLALLLPILFLMTAFPCSVVVSAAMSMLGPVAHYNRNSAFYSATPPERIGSAALLPITVQMPVYKEDLDDVITPTIESLKKAITTFERQGGSVNVIVCDDGLQLVSPEERDRRIKYYRDNNVAYTARPPHGQDGFLRRGRFKKAGNLNYCNRLSLKVEDLMKELKPAMMERLGTGEEDWSEAEEKMLYEEALEKAIEGDEGRTWAAGNIRIGEIILLIDSDTRVPEDCFLDASLEMSQSPQVAIIQHVSGVMQVANHFFENGMAFFTSLLQVSISMSVAGGNVAPFVGHNAFLRWSALQEVAQIDDYDGEPRVWSECHVSEDFQIALNLQSNGWQLRWANYSNNEFQEGVSLTCADELSRWQKYAWGCSEIVFNPLVQWPRRGPFTKLFRKFLWSPIPPQAKWGIMGYMFSYYAIGLAWCLTIVNFLIVGILTLEDSFYVSSWSVFCACLIVFYAADTIATIVLRYRLKLPEAGQLALNQFKWMPFFFIFFGGISFAVGQSLVCHLFSINMSWTSTSKTVEKSNFFYQLPKILKRFWPQIAIGVVVLAGMAISTTNIVPKGYRADGQLTAMLPLIFTWASHILWPFVLDPYFTTFTF